MRRFGLICCIAAAVGLASVPVVAAEGPPARQGYWWYEAPKPAPSADKDGLLSKPVIPPMAELAGWPPKRIARLIEDQRDYAATVLTVDAVADFWRLTDFARRKARAFAGVTQMALLRYPELDARSANPMVGDARAGLSAEKEAVRRQTLRKAAGEFALVMFSRASCGYCRVQWPILERFREETGWSIASMDLDRRPELALRYGIAATPTMMVIRRGTRQRMVIANGVEAYPGLAQAAFQAVRLLTGEIRPEQFLTGPGEEGGFFDALANGPVGAGDADPGEERR